MNKRILIFGALTVFMLVTISFASAINNNTTTQVDKKESPLYRIRTRAAIGEKIGQIFKNIKAKFLRERIFFMPIGLLRNNINDDSMASIVVNTCVFNPCTWEEYCYTCDEYCYTSEKQCTLNQYTCD